MIAHHLNGIFNGLRSPDIKMHPAFDAEFFLDVLGNFSGQPDLFFMQILAGQLRQGVDLLFKDIIKAFILIAKIGRGIPHLQIQIFHALGIIQINALSFTKNIQAAWHNGQYRPRNSISTLRPTIARHSFDLILLLNGSFGHGSTTLENNDAHPPNPYKGYTAILPSS